MRNEIKPANIEPPKDQTTILGEFSKLVPPLPKSLKTAVKTSARFAFSMGLFEKVGEIAIAQNWLINAKALLWFGRFTQLVPVSIMIFLALLGVSFIVLGIEIINDIGESISKKLKFFNKDFNEE